MHCKLNKEACKAITESIGKKKADFVFSSIGHLNCNLLKGKINDEEWSNEAKTIAAKARKPRLIQRIFMTDRNWAKQVALVDELYMKITKL
ncbi:Uncharacterised protein [uncultured archaeon]|nr:Uncharacterised protein [uncultured archaeon]